MFWINQGGEGVWLIGDLGGSCLREAATVPLTQRPDEAPSKTINFATPSLNFNPASIKQTAAKGPWGQEMN